MSSPTYPCKRQLKPLHHLCKTKPSAHTGYRCLFDADPPPPPPPRSPHPLLAMITCDNRECTQQVAAGEPCCLSSDRLPATADLGITHTHTRVHTLIHTNYLVCQTWRCSNPGSLSDMLSRQQGEAQVAERSAAPGGHRRHRINRMVLTGRAVKTHGARIKKKCRVNS